MVYNPVSSATHAFNVIAQMDWMTHCGKVYDKTSKMRTTFDIFEKVVSVNPVQEALGPLGEVLNEGLQKAEPLFTHAKVLSFTGVLHGTSNLRRSVRYLIEGKGDRIENFFHSIFAVRTIAGATQTFVDGVQEFPYEVVPLEKGSPLYTTAEKVVASALPVLKHIVKILSVTFLISHLYEYHKTRLFQKRLADLKNQEGDLAANLRAFLESVSSGELSQHFRVPGEDLQRKVNDALQDSQKTRKVYALLQTRVQGTQDSKKLLLLGDFICTGMIGLSILNLAGTVVRAVSQANFVWLMGHSAYQSKSAQQFLKEFEN